MKSLERTRILVADDDAGIRLLLVTFLRRQGFHALQARNGREALSVMRAGHADLLILDLMMPVLSGMDVLRARSADPALQCIPAIVITASNRDGAARLLDSQVSAVLGKPFDLDALLAAVRTCLEQHPVPHPVAA